MHHKRGGYSYLIRPILIGFDLIILFFLSRFFLPNLTSDIKFSAFLFISWLCSAYLVNFYDVYRFTRILTIISRLLQQATLMLVLMYAYFGLLRIVAISFKLNSKFIFVTVTVVGVLKLLSYYGLRRYRSYLGGNNRRVIIIGNNKSAQQLYTFFNKRKEMGYKVLKVFADSLSDTIEDSFEFLEKEDIDEIYCSIDEISEETVNEYVKYADKHFAVLKFIPKTQHIYSKRLQTDYYEYLPVLSVPEVSLNSVVNRFFKRAFDIIFSLLVIILVLSWAIPLLYVIIKLESPGPLIYSHKRNGINYKEFVCYKFRSMTHQKHTDLEQVKKQDERVTKIGSFMRRTSIDELPQFFNVLFGDMSVVGPRPHMLSYTKDYSTRIDKYNYVFRHSVKPGITGLAQISGFRGEVESDEDIINRIKYDIFYIENWSILLDIKIIFETIINIIRGEDKAY